MKFGRAWCLAIGVLVAAGGNPKLWAQNDPDKQKRDGGSNAGASQGQTQSSDANKLKQQQGNAPAGSASQVLLDQQLQYGWQFPSWQGNNPQLFTWTNDLSGQNAAWVAGTVASIAELNLAETDDSVREHLNLPNGQGIVVREVTPGSGAARAGIEQNDILLSLGDASLGKPTDLYDQLKLAGEKSVSLALLRAGKRVTLQVQPLVRVTLRPVQAVATARKYWIGISVTPIEPVLRAQLRLSPNHKVIVNKVFAESAAAKSGIALHDIIVTLDGMPISDPNDVAKAVQAKGEKPLTLEVVGKNGKSRTVVMTPERVKVGEGTKLGAVSDNPHDVGRSLSYDVVHPGFLVDYYTTLYNSSKDGSGYLNQVPLYSNQVPLLSNANKNGQATDEPLSKRLDSLDSDIKELRKLVEEVQKIATRIIEQRENRPGSDDGKSPVSRAKRALRIELGRAWRGNLGSNFGLGRSTKTSPAFSSLLLITGQCLFRLCSSIVCEQRMVARSYLPITFAPPGARKRARRTTLTLGART